MPDRTATAAREVGARLRLAFGRAPATPAELPVDTPAIASVPVLEVTAYAEDCILSGSLRLSAERLSDLLNTIDAYEFADVLVEDLVGGRAVQIRDVLVQRDELLVVQATGPRGNAQRRLRTRQHPIVAKAGPYEVHGYIHVTPGTNPIASLRHRRPMVVLTGARIEYSIGTVRQVRRAPVVMLNRECLDWVVEGEDEPVETLEMPVEMGGALLKDFTGMIRV